MLKARMTTARIVPHNSARKLTKIALLNSVSINQLPDLVSLWARAPGVRVEAGSRAAVT